MRVRRMVGTMIAALLVAGGTAWGETAPAVQPDAGTQLLGLVNEHRTGRGLPRLSADPGLQRVAREHSLRMAQTGVLEHNDALFTRAMHDQLGIARFGENVAWDHSVPEAHAALLASPQHHENIVSSTYRLAGFAAATDANGRWWVTEVFGSARKAPVVRTVTVRARVAAAPLTAPRTVRTARPAARTAPAAPPPAPAPAVARYEVRDGVRDGSVTVRAAADPVLAKRIAVPAASRSGSDTGVAVAVAILALALVAAPFAAGITRRTA